MIEAKFHPDFFRNLYFDIKFFGVAKVMQRLVLDGHHESFAKAAVRKVIREKGW